MLVPAARLCPGESADWNRLLQKLRADVPGRRRPATGRRRNTRTCRLRSMRLTCRHMRAHRPGQSLDYAPRGSRSTRAGCWPPTAAGLSGGHLRPRR